MIMEHVMKKSAIVLLTLLMSVYALSTDLDLSQKPLEVPQGAAPNVVIIMDDSGSMDWEIVNGNAQAQGGFVFNQPFIFEWPVDSGTYMSEHPTAGAIKQKYHWNELTTCVPNDGLTINGQLVGYVYGVEFGSNEFDDDNKDCLTADEEAWRFRNHDYNALYYNPTRTYEPWAGVNADGVPYNTVADQLKIDEPTAAGFSLIGFDNPYKPTEWLDLNFHNTNWQGGETAHTSTSDKDGDFVADGFSYYTWEDSNANGFFDNWVDANANSIFDDGEGDNVQEVRVNTLSAAEQKNFQTWFNFYRSRELASKAAIFGVLENIVSARIGHTSINSGKNAYDDAGVDKSPDIEVAEMNPDPYLLGSNKRQLLNEIARSIPGSGTPLRQSLYDVGQYYSCSASNNRFGLSSEDLDGDGLLNDPACPYLPVEEGGTCQQNYALLFSDGVWNGSLNPSVGDTDGDVSNYGGQIFSDGGTPPAPPVERENTLADVAMHFYQNDIYDAYADEVTVTNIDLEREPKLEGVAQMHQHMKTYTVAFGLGLPDINAEILDNIDITQTIDWDSPSLYSGKVQDMLHAALNGRGYFYSTDDDEVLKNDLIDSFNKILAEQSGAAGVSFNSQELKTGTYVFRAFYNPSTFDGDLVAIEFDSNGIPDVDNPIWSASEKLDDVIADGQRLIVSYDPDTQSGISFDYDAGLNATQQGWFEQDPPAMLPNPYGDGDATHGDERLSYLWGDSSNEGVRTDIGDLRDRAGLLGDFANSTPRYVGVPQGLKRDFSPYPIVAGTLYSEFKAIYLYRDQLVYSGANDGMLHAFDANTGREKFAYVPNSVMDDLYEYTLPSYIHEMSVDGSPGINDVFLRDGTEQWKTVLMGGLRAGGKGYYALDITNPATFTAAGMPGNVMWEFTGDNDDRLGYTFSTPNMVMSNAVDGASGNQRWISLFGNGYNQSNADGESALFALFIDAGLDGDWYKVSQFNNFSNDDYIVMQTGEGSFTQDYTETDPITSVTTTVTKTYPNGLGTPRAIDTDGNGTADIVYAGDLAGNLFRFDISDIDPANWSMSEVMFTASFPIDATNTTRQPITVQPIVTLNEAKGGNLVVFSTGSWMTVDDITSADVQSLYAIWDHSSVSYPVSRISLVEQEFENQVNPLFGYSYRTLTNYDINFKTSGTPAKQVLGWVVDFDLCAAGSVDCTLADIEYPGERAIRNLLIKDGVLFGVTILPTSNEACSVAPGGFLFSIDSQSGGVVQEKPAFDLNDDGEFNIDDIVDDGDDVVEDEEVPAAIRIDDGLPSDIAIIDGGANDGSKVCYQTSTGKLVCSGANVDSKYPEGRLSWKELAD